MSDRVEQFRALALAVLLVGAVSGGAAADDAAALISPRLPVDLNPDAGGAAAASLEQAAMFAWRDFIALNWPAKSGVRGIPDDVPLDHDPRRPRVWETLRARVEVYPGHGDPNGYAPTAADYGFDAAPDYIYAENIGDGTGRVPPCDRAGAPPWHNLDEPSQQQTHSGLSPPAPFPGQQVLVESKVNRPGYVYVAARGWYGKNSIRKPARRTGKYIRTHLQPPKYASVADDPDDLEYVSFPNGFMELKAAWRRLGQHDRNDRFHRSQVRYYRIVDEQPCYVDSDEWPGDTDTWGLLALHIAHKIPSAPYFIWATFEQVDNLVGPELDEDGHIVNLEAADGSVIDPRTGSGPAYTPDLRLAAATVDSDQSYVIESGEPMRNAPDLRLYYHQDPVYGIPEMRYVAVNRRLHATPTPIAEVNRLVQAAIREAAPESPLQHYRLVAVQWRPLDKKPGEPYTGPESPAVYYAANVVIESPPVHQGFSGQFSHGFSLASDYVHREMLFLNPQPNPGDPVYFNVYHDGRGFLAGGCMGCHGARQSYGTDWSFLLYRQRVETPDILVED